jgi:hypothetical protein
MVRGERQRRTCTTFRGNLTYRRSTRSFTAYVPTSCHDAKARASYGDKIVSTLSDAERATLGAIGHRLGRKVLAEVATIARPDTILTWYRKLVARKFSGSQDHEWLGNNQRDSIP